MTTLAIDTATELLSVALGAGGRVLSRRVDAGLRHSELLMPTVDALLAEAGIPPAALDLLACMQGPGSFTGVRIGFAAVKGIAAALGVPYIAVPTLDCMARPFAAEAALVVPAIDAKKGRFFAGLYRGGARLSPLLDAAPAELAALCAEHCAPRSPFPLILSGTGAPLLAPLLAECLPREAAPAPGPQCRLCAKGWAEELLALAEEAFAREGPPAEEPKPLYLRKSDAELKAAPAASI
ncbi:MAG: tRNA (adenosine(37)-N6)-threonylcarbamoyltransferase complex dimerization subunit type 1 TsaB [Treponema sp.]|jgi:tRNA threonylcarbamoyladenosine biosynthesis protein TsaB|nr:tRNA (adenosine(37)-N6)-threonylcarbamoyltransferase complex dimerization subunit type 1 TsaB [Treponema sp.]